MKKCLENDYFDYEIKKLPTKASLFQAFLHFKGCPCINHKISLWYDLYFEHFFGFSYPFHDASSYGSTFKRVYVNEDSI